MFVNLVSHCEFELVPAVLFRPGMNHGCHLDVGKLFCIAVKFENLVHIFLTLCR